MITICSVCLKELTELQIKNALSCPNCGTTSIPMEKGNDITVTLNIQQARCLTMFASRWVQEKCLKESPDTVRSLSNTIDKFKVLRPEIEWTLGDAMKMLREKFGKVDIAGEEPIL